MATYAQIAKALGSPKSARAVGNALNKNPFPGERVPCHRVVRSDGTVGGFMSGTGKKIALLRREGVEMKNGKIDLSVFGVKKL